jgi:hypothetical protein
MKKLFFITILVLAIGSIVTINWLRQPNKGSIESKSNNEVLSATKTNVDFQSKLFSTAINSSLRVKTSNENNSGPIFSQYLLASKNNGDDSQIAITVAEKDSEIDEVSPAKFRLLDANQYQQSTTAFAPADSLVFIKNSSSSYEIAIIWSNSNNYSAVVGSGTTAHKEQIDELVADIVTNWKWKN